MTKTTANLILNELHTDWDDEAKLYEDYSGRSMYGTTTTGVQATYLSDIEGAIAALVKREELTISESNRIRFDSIGVKTIIY